MGEGDLKALLHKAKSEPLTKTELADIRDAIHRRQGDLYTLLHILGRAAMRSAISAEDRRLVEEFLEYQHDPMVSAISVRILCLMWGFTDDYYPYLKRVIMGLAWDDEDHVRLVALSSLAQSALAKKDATLISKIRELSHDKRALSGTREAAEDALRKLATN